MDVYAVPPAGSQPAPEWYAPVSSEPKRLGGLATALTVLLAFAAVLSAVLAAVLLYRASLLQGVLDGETLDPDDAEAIDATVNLLTVLFWSLYIAIGIVFIIWQYRHAKNTLLLGPQRGLGPGWAIGGWFIPMANAILPAMQIFGASRYSDSRVIGAVNARGRGARIVIPWAITFFVGATVAFLYMTFEPSGSYEDQVQSYLEVDQVSAVGQLILIVAAILAIVMVRSLSSRQERALAARAGGPWSGQTGASTWDSAPVQPSAPWTQQSLGQPTSYPGPGYVAPLAPPVPPPAPPQ